MARRSLGNSVCAGILVVFLPALAAAQPASLLLDINTTPGENPSLSGHIYPHSLKTVGDRLYFLAEGVGAGGEIWVSDGTSTGTEIVRDLCAGPCSANAGLVGPLGKAMLWIAETETFQRQLWRSDGTRPGTFALTEPEIEVEGPFAFFGRSLYFTTCSGSGEERSCDLWKTNGSVTGTRAFHTAPRSVSWMHVAGGRLYYLAQQESQYHDLWVTDGTAAGTVRLRRFEVNSGSPEGPVSAGGRLFFRASIEDQEVWTSDGTVTGTRALTNFPAGNPFDPANWLKPVGNRVYFVADDGAHGREIWRTDGTPAGTVRLTDLAEGVSLPDDEPSLLAEVGGIVVFRAHDSESPALLWTTRGTPESTAPLAISCEGCEIERFTGLVESNSRAFFVAETDRDATELWVTDGTAAGSRKVKELCGPFACSFGGLRAFRGGVLLALEVFQGEEQLWFSDGTPAGTGPFTGLPEAATLDEPLTIAELGGDVYFVAAEESEGLWVRDSRGKTRPVFTLPLNGPSSDPQGLTALGSRLLFTAVDGQTGSGLWASGGTPETTIPLNLPGVSWGGATRQAGLVFFHVEVFEEQELWRTNGTPEGTFRIASLTGKALMIPFQEALYFFDGQEIWKTDGTAQGTVKTGDLPEELLSIEFAAPGPNGIYLKTVTSVYKSEFWFTDGTSVGTRPITDLNAAGVNGADPQFTSVGPAVYFTWDFDLWKTDGTAAGTKVVAGLPANRFATKLFAHQGALYFFTASDSFAHELRLWRTDGTAAGMVELGRFPGQDTYYFPLRLTPFAGKLFFNVDDGVHGIELWTTDGTPAGTALVRDLVPGPRSSRPTQLTVAGGRLFFTAGDDLHGMELWQSDGTAAGTRLVQDIRPQAPSSVPQQLTVVGDKLFFTADDGITGREVWMLPLSGSSACKPSSTRLCLGAGRYAVEAAWRDFEGRRGVGRAVPLTADTGYFWFFDPANVEAVLKVLDGRGVNGHVWVFYGALSSVEYTLTVTDTETGLAHRYANPSGQLASVGDTHAFGPLGASAQAVATSVSTPSPLALVSRRIVPSAAKSACAPSSTRLCLNGARFAVEIAWKDFEGRTGTGKAVELTGDTGYFWFFDAANVEVVLKVLDGTPVNGHHWVFYGSLSSVEYTVTVTDTETGEVNTYKNVSGRLASVADTGAF